VQKFRLLLLLMVSPLLLFAQARTQIKLETAEHATGATKANVSYLRKPIFSHDGAILKCDSAVLYGGAKNFFEAFGNVHINQGDTLNIYSDFLNYDGNSKKAHLDKNVKLIDRENTLTSNVLDYDMVAKIGKYTTGGKLVNKDATITSKRGVYFSNYRDVYFTKDVLIVTTEKTIINSDSLRYNTGTNWTYFYGPTNIKSKDDKLYTEDGAYNTKTENAYFGKKNLYTNGSRSLKGDSLYYYGKRGYGRAVKNIIFKDTKDQTTLYGQLGEYYRDEERVIVTQKAYVGIGTKDSVTVKNKKIPDTLWMAADTLESQRALVKTLKLLSRPEVKKDNEIGAEDEKEKAEKDKEKAEARKLLQQQTEEQKKGNATNVDKKLSRKERKQLEEAAKKQKEKGPPLIDSLLANKNKLKQDSVIADSLAKLKKMMPEVKTDSIKNSVQKAVTTKTKNVVTTTKTNVANNIKRTTGQIAKPLATDSAFNPADTVRARIIKAYHNVRVYKSNMQAKADSLFYTAADSSLRWYRNPILWSDGSQQTGDTIHVFFKNNKIHNFQVLQNGFIVNIEGDSTKFNQVKGKVITGFFVDGEMRNMYVDGNAESIYYTKDNQGNYDNVNQTVSSRLRFKFLNKELTHIVTVREVEGAVDPMDKLTKEPLLTGFTWKPELRPKSKADIIRGLPAAKPKAGNKPIKKAPTTSNKGKTTVASPSKAPTKPTQKEVVKQVDTAAKNIQKLLPKATDSLKLDSLKKQN